MNKEALSNFKDISIKEKSRLKEFGLIKTIGENILLTHSGKGVLKIIKKYLN